MTTDEMQLDTDGRGGGGGVGDEPSLKWGDGSD